MIDIFSDRCRTIFTFDNLQKTAAFTGFYKKKSKLTPEKFFDLLLYCASLHEPLSLEQSVSKLKRDLGIDIAKQSLDERFSEEAVLFVKEIMRQALELELGNLFDRRLFPGFNYVRVKDSTRFNVADGLAEYYKGSGGNGTRKGCVCIQYEYDIKSGKILDLEITAGTVNDAANAKETKLNIKEGDLVIRDLGYYNLDILTSFHKESAYFISRLNMSTSIFEEETGEEISFEVLYNRMVSLKRTILDKEVLISKGKKTKFRLVAVLLPEHEYQKRVRNINKKNKESGYNTSDDYKARARLNIFITNVPSEMLSTEDMLTLYRVRWQIELTFKSWKSVCGINRIQPMKYERFTCVLVAKLILIIIRIKIYWLLNGYFYKVEGRMLSQAKSFKTFQVTYDLLRLLIKSGKKESVKSFKRLIKIFSANHWLERRKKRVNYCEIIELFICNTDNYDYIRSKKRAA